MERIADLLFQNTTKTAQEYLEQFPKRNLPPDAKVTRFAPSPTGFMHIGGVFAALVSARIAQQSKGVFMLRIEDTDKNREVHGGIQEIINSLHLFHISIDEGMVSETEEKGAYGSYQQSKRVDIYNAFAKELIKNGHAYPCFCTTEQLDEIRKQQDHQKIDIGYYGEWALHRNLSEGEIEERLEKGEPHVIRLKSTGKPNTKHTFHDLIKGDVTIMENFFDTVLLKSDGLPTYHFAHVVDDHLMHTNPVLRGDEWLPSLPLHLELFRCFGWEKPPYGHLAPILKMDGTSKRKLSKRKDPEAAVSFYVAEGYPIEAVIDYLLNIANSDFESWRKNNPNSSNKDFELKLNKLNDSGALFDFDKLNNISKNHISKLSAEAVYDATMQWSSQFDQAFYQLLIDNRNYVLAILQIDRGIINPRKDIAKWNEVKDYLSYFFDPFFDQAQYEFPETIPPDLIQQILQSYPTIHNEADDKDTWFEKVKQQAEQLGFTADTKAYKANKDLFKGTVADFMSIIRIAITKRSKCPDMLEVMKVLGAERMLERLTKAERSL